MWNKSMYIIMILSKEISENTENTEISNIIVLVSSYCHKFFTFSETGTCMLFQYKNSWGYDHAFYQTQNLVKLKICFELIDYIYISNSLLYLCYSLLSDQF